MTESRKKSDDIAALSNDYMMNTYSKTATIVRGKGCRVYGADGMVYLDFTAGISVLNIGHSHPRYIDAVRDQLDTLVHCSNLFYNPQQALLAERLVKLSGLNGKVFFCNSGAEANEAMIKLARAYGHDAGKYEIICMKQSFHGRTMATLSATGQSKVQKGFDPLLLGFEFADFNDIESVRALVSERTVAVLVEAVQGEGGVIPADPGFMKSVRKLCDEKGLLMLCDEIQCGMGRTGKWFGWQHYDVKPDAFTLAKSLAGGIPMGALIASEKLADVFVPGSHGSTFGGGALACAAAHAVLSIMEDEKLVEAAERMGALFTKALEQFVEKYPQVLGVRGKGLLVGLVVDGCADEILEDLRLGGMLACKAGPDVVRFLPPLCISEKEMEEAVEMIGDTLDNLYGGEEE